MVSFVKTKQYVVHSESKIVSAPAFIFKINGMKIYLSLKNIRFLGGVHQKMTI